MRMSDWSSDGCSSDRRTPQHIYAQIIAPDASVTVVSASTVEKTLAEGLEGTGNVAAAKKVGEAIATRAKEKGITKVAFDRAGFQYHGRIKALADAARAAGLERSEEHTSELQSLMRISYAVFCLKKKNKLIKNKT